MSERLLRWFGDRRNEQILGMVREHLELTQGAVNELYNMVSRATDAPTKQTYYQSISRKEMRADELRRRMVTELSIRNVYPDERDDLMELVRAVDWIADWSREAGRIMLIIPFENTPEEMRQAAADMCKTNVDCVTVLARCIQELSVNPPKALELADQVEMLEEDIDELYAVARGFVSGLEFPGFTRGALILLNEFLDAIETVADWCENTADIVRAIAVRVL
jgi:predicted phosphate transport protein (TIGR00153 family)